MGMSYAHHERWINKHTGKHKDLLQALLKCGVVLKICLIYNSKRVLYYNSNFGHVFLNSIQKHAIHRHQSGVLWDFKRKRSPVCSRQLWSICDVGLLQRIVTDMVDDSIVRVTAPQVYQEFIIRLNSGNIFWYIVGHCEWCHSMIRNFHEIIARHRKFGERPCSQRSADW